MSADPARALPAIATPAEHLAGLAGAYPSTPQTLVLTPPQAQPRPKVERTHADIRVDEYAWLRHREDPHVLAYLEAENRYTDAVMQPTERLQDELFEEMRARIKETDLSVPEPLDDWLYYSRTEAGSQYPIHCRRTRRGRARPKRSSSTSTLWPRGRATSGWARSTSAPITGCWPGRRTRAAPSRSPCGEGPRDRRAARGAHRQRLRQASPGPTTAGRSSTWCSTRPAVPAGSSATGSATIPPATRWCTSRPTKPSSSTSTRTRSRAYLLLELSSHSTSEVRFSSADRPEERSRS